MRKFYALLLIPALLFGAGHLYAQSCEPNMELPDSVIVDPLPYQEDFPERGIPDTACVGSYFETVLQFQLPEMAVILGNEVTINGASIALEGAIENLPAGFDYNCNPPICVFEPDSVGCIIVYGTAEAGTEDVYDLKINVTIDIGIPFSTQLPNDQLAPGNYFFHVRGEDGPNCTVISAVNYQEDAGFQLTITPNPANAQAILDVELEQSGRYQLNIYDLLGQQVLNRSVELVAGENQLTIDAAQLPAGMYVFTLDDGQKGASGRLVVQR